MKSISGLTGSELTGSEPEISPRIYPVDRTLTQKPRRRVVNSTTNSSAHGEQAPVEIGVRDNFWSVASDDGIEFDSSADRTRFVTIRPGLCAESSCAAQLR